MLPASSSVAPRGALRYVASPFDSLTGRDVYEVLALRAEIFVVEQTCAYLDPDGHDPAAWHLLGRDASGTLGTYARIFLATPGPQGNGAHVIGRVVVHAALRGTGEGRRLMREAIAFCEQRDPRAPIELSAQAHLARFYESLGFVAVSERYLMDGIDHLDMRREGSRVS